jgi:hypothetical protein
MDNNGFEILVPLNNSDTVSIQAPLKRVRAVGKSKPYLATNKDKHIKIKQPFKDGFRYTSKYSHIVEKHLNKR